MVLLRLGRRFSSPFLVLVILPSLLGGEIGLVVARPAQAGLLDGVFDVSIATSALAKGFHRMSGREIGLTVEEGSDAITQQVRSVDSSSLA